MYARFHRLLRIEGSKRFQIPDLDAYVSPRQR